MAVTNKEAFNAMCKVAEYCMGTGCDECIFTHGDNKNLCSLGAMPEYWVHQYKKETAKNLGE